MKSYKQLYQKLQPEFIESISAQYTQGQMDRIFAGFMTNRLVTLRVNTLKTDVRSVMEVFRRDNVKFDRVQWYEDALIIKNKREKDLEKHELYKEGHIYLQSLSSMVPPLVLNPKPGSKVLDLTAAPGSKSTQLAALMGNKGFILANEINSVRAERLKYNVALQGADIVEVRVGDGKTLEDKWHEFFDYVLLDAPCSGVGLFSMEDSRTYRGWSVKTVEKLSREQKKLMDKALWALKSGGTMVYSTCTLMKEENEDNIEWFLENYGDMVSMEEIDFPMTGADTLSRPIKIRQHKDSTMVILPSNLYEGFFVSKFKKL